MEAPSEPEWNPNGAGAARPDAVFGGGGAGGWRPSGAGAARRAGAVVVREARPPRAPAPAPEAGADRRETACSPRAAAELGNLIHLLQGATVSLATGLRGRPPTPAAAVLSLEVERALGRAQESLEAATGFVAEALNACRCGQLRAPREPARPCIVGWASEAPDAPRFRGALAVVEEAGGFRAPGARVGGADVFVLTAAGLSSLADELHARRAGVAEWRPLGERPGPHPAHVGALGEPGRAAEASPCYFVGTYRPPVLTD